MKENTKKRVGTDLTEGPILSKLIVFVLPLLAANLLQQLYNVVDTIVIGQFVGSTGTVGVSTGGEIAAMITFIATAFGQAGQIYVAQLTGAKDTRGSKEMTGTLVSATLLMGIVCMVLCIVLCPAILGWLNCPEEALSQATGYMIVVSIGLPFVFGFNALCGIMRGMGESTRPMVFTAIATVANVILDLLLVVAIPLEAVGTAIATIGAQIASFVAAMIFVLKRQDVFGLNLNLKSYKIRMEYLKPLMRLGIPMSAQSVFVHFSQLICSSRINTYGLVASATNSVGNKIQKLITVFITSVNGGAGSMVGQNLGAQKYDRVKKIIHQTLIVSGVICVLASMISIFLPRQAFALFTKDQEVIEMGVTYMHICIIIYIFAALQGGFMSVVTGTGNAKLNFLSGILDGVILRLGISFLLAYAFNMGVVGFFYGNAFARIGPVLVGGIYYFSGRWQNYDLLKRNGKVKTEETEE